MPNDHGMDKGSANGGGVDSARGEGGRGRLRKDEKASSKWSGQCQCDATSDKSFRM